MVEDRVDRLLVAVDDVEHAGREAGLLEQLPDQHRGGGIALGRLQDEGVAAGDGDRIHPHRHHGREIERRDAGDDAERLAVGPAVDLGADIAAELALEEMRNAAGELDDLDAARDLAQRVGVGLAVLARDRAGDLVGVAIQQLLEAEHVLARFSGGVVPQPTAACLGGGDGGIRLRRRSRAAARRSARPSPD